MCKQGVHIYFCTVGQHEVGEPVVVHEYPCREAESVGFGACGKVTRARPGHFFTKCDDCLAKRRGKTVASRAVSRADSRPTSRASSRATSRFASRIPTRVTTPTTKADDSIAKTDIPADEANTSVAEDADKDLPSVDDDDAQSTY